MKQLLTLALLAVTLSSCASDPVFQAPDTIFPGKGKEIDGAVYRATLCKVHRVPVKVIDGFHHAAILDVSSKQRALVGEYPNIVGKGFSTTRDTRHPHPTKAFSCPKCEAGFKATKFKN